MISYLAASLASASQMPQQPEARHDKQKCLQISPSVPPGMSELSPVENLYSAPTSSPVLGSRGHLHCTLDAAPQFTKNYSVYLTPLIFTAALSGVF